MTVYKSKIDWWLIIVIGVLFCYPIVEGIITKDYFLSLVFFGLISLIFLMFKSIKYKIDGQFLIIWWIKIDILKIKKIYSTNNPLSSPALSLDRIAVTYNKFDEVLISPKKRAEFIAELLKINPNIVVEV
ncbi:PH domain-containing protein [Flavobacterium sedimenticola]|uniref:PH domain-containing protein n=1 Tax=Flavobacterium sedimenticola TaxID=3043286 RepID=A0ABT6XP50_9FLAO|nr:PH domain-containing protein [Flavobacterium sedimenticola]MDI9256622.1 PH domain-containing protein [Flavobacterium sedimenticola]